MKQLFLFPEENTDPRPPESINWNLWHGCTKASPGCLHCYKILKSGKYKGRYKVPFGSHIWTCFSSDFFHADADEWREDAWDMIHERSDCSFFMITKRPERIADHLPNSWGKGWEHVTIAVTCENQEMADKRLPVYLSLPLFHHSVMIEPMLTAVDLQPYIEGYPHLTEAQSSSTYPLAENPVPEPESVIIPG